MVIQGESYVSESDQHQEEYLWEQYSKDDRNIENSEDMITDATVDDKIAVLSCGVSDDSGVVAEFARNNTYPVI